MAHVLVEDDESVRRVLTIALRDDGYRVDEVIDDASALSVIKDRQPDVILLDLKMPGMGGGIHPVLSRAVSATRAHSGPRCCRPRRSARPCGGRGRCAPEIVRSR